MNISTISHHVPIQTVVNPQTDNLRRENHQREIITKPEPSAQAAAEKGVASDKERGRTPAQLNENVDFANLRKSAEQESKAINDSSGQSQSEERAKDDSQSEQNTESNQGNENNSSTSNSEEYVEKQEIIALELRDQEVRNHERAHASVGGSLTGAPSYTYEIGPNGKQYAVEGEVSVDLTPIAGEPKETIAKMKQVQAAALAPADPSAQDIRVAASASGMILEAQAEMLAMQSSEDEKTSSASSVYRNKEMLAEEENAQNNEDSRSFDQLISQTLSSQEEVSPSRPVEVDERAGRIEQFYSSINQAYEKPPSFQFELTA